MMQREQALRVAERLMGHWRPFCERIEIAGSVRRNKPEVKDIEIVALPKLPTNLLGEFDASLPSELDHHIDQVVERGHLFKRKIEADGKSRVHAYGPRYKALESVDGARIDLFCVIPPAQWGAVFTIRTGPGDFSQHMVTACKKKGLWCHKGALRREDDGTIVLTPEEEDFFRECGVTWIPPEERR